MRFLNRYVFVYESMINSKLNWIVKGQQKCNDFKPANITDTMSCAAGPRPRINAAETHQRIDQWHDNDQHHHHLTKINHYTVTPWLRLLAWPFIQRAAF